MYNVANIINIFVKTKVYVLFFKIIYNYDDKFHKIKKDDSFVVPERRGFQLILALSFQFIY